MHILLKHRADGWVQAENNGGGHPTKAFDFLGVCRKSGVTRTVSFGDHGYGMNGVSCFKVDALPTFLDLAERHEIVADFAGSETHKEYLHSRECERAAMAALAERTAA